MLREFGRVRVNATGMYGTIVDWRSSDDHCEVELDGWQHEGQIDGDRQLPYTFAISDLEELNEVGQNERKAVFDSFDTMVIASACRCGPSCRPRGASFPNSARVASITEAQSNSP